MSPRVETDTVAAGLDEDVIRMISAKKNEPRVHARLAPEGLSPLADHDRTASGRRSIIRPSTTRPSATTRRRSRARTGRRAWPRSIRNCCAPTRSSACRSKSASCWPAWRSMRCSTASRWPPPSRTSWPNSASSSAPFSEAVREHPELVQQYLGSVVPYTDNFFATLNSAVFSDGSFCLHPARRALPDGVVHLLPHQRQEHRPVRAHADHRRPGRLRQLPRRLHGADARREPAARGRGRTDRAGRRADQVRDGAELVSRRQARAAAASTTSSPSAATAAATTRTSPGRRSRPARPSPGSIRA